jgi:hypothetical protein
LTFSFYVVSRGSAKFVGTNTAQATAGVTMQQAPNATFDATSLSGNYAFLLAGSAPGGMIATAGSFSANGSGCLTANTGVLDENVNGTAAPNLSFSPVPSSDLSCPGSAGKYTVDPSGSGRGTVTFATTTANPTHKNNTYSLVFYLGATGNAVLQEIDSGIVSDGSFAQQQSTVFSLTSMQGTYAIASSGLSGSFAQVFLGQLQLKADGTGGIQSGTIDINTGGTLTQLQIVNSASNLSTYSISANGRATLILNPSTDNRNFAGYIVNSTQVIIVGIDTGRVAAGAMYKQF